MRHKKLTFWEVFNKFMRLYESTEFRNENNSIVFNESVAT